MEIRSPLWSKKPGSTDGFQHRGQIVMEDYHWDGDKPLEKRACDLVIYEMHVRSFTRHSSSGVKHPGTYVGLVEKIPYLKKSRPLNFRFCRKNTAGTWPLSPMD